MDDIEVPESIQLLGGEAARLRDWIKAALLEDEPATVPIDAPLAAAAGVVAERIANDVTALVRVFSGPDAGQATHGDGGVGPVYRTVGRLEEILERLLDTWRAARDMPVEPDDAWPHELLVDGVRDVIKQVASVFDRLATMIAHPDMYDVDVDNTVRATLRCTLSNPAEFEELTDWWRAHRASDAAQQRRGQFWGTAGAIALGALLGGTLFGGNGN